MEPFIGQIQMFGFNFAPRGWAFCDGQLLPISQHNALFSLLGTTYGGDGRTTLQLPDLRGRSAVQPGRGPGLSNVRQGERGGVEQVTLTSLQMPSHNHTAVLNAERAGGTSARPANNMLARTGANRNFAPPVAAENTPMAAESVQVLNSGGNQPFSIRDPYLGVYHCIALVGLYPSRS